MTFEEFRRRAGVMFDSIPESYREGVDGLEVTRRTVPHPSLPDVFTLGECLSESYPSDFGGPGEIRSRVVLYYGSFLELSRTADDWDWEGELWETITHEIRHHLEHLALEDALEEMDYAEDQNFARREAESFEPFFFRAGREIGLNTFEVDGDIFIEVHIDPKAFERMDAICVSWNGEELAVTRPDELGDVHFLRIDDSMVAEKGELFAVLVRRRGAGEWLRGLLGGGPLRVLESSASRLRE
jgi:hypothetical protein